LKEQVTLDRETERTTDGCDFREPDIAEFRVTETEVTETKGEIGIDRIEFPEELGGGAIRSEELDDGIRIDLLAAHGASAIGERFGTLLVGDERMGHGCLRFDHPPVESGEAKGRGSEASASGPTWSGVGRA
jgi:hypothetical protein